MLFVTVGSQPPTMQLQTARRLQDEATYDICWWHQNTPLGPLPFVMGLLIASMPQLPGSIRVQAKVSLYRWLGRDSRHVDQMQAIHTTMCANSQS